MKPFLAPFLVLILLGCNSSTTTTKTRISGKIIHPKNNYIVVNRESFTDTIPLNDDGEFSKSYDSLQEGAYRFVHAKEFQYFLLSPEDQIKLFLDTQYFDESLAYSEKGSLKNNILTQITLDFEEVDHGDLFGSSLDEFQSKTQILLTQQLSKLNEFRNLTNEHESFAYNYLKYIVLYRIYTLKEIYFFRKKDKIKFPANYFDYRNSYLLQNFILGEKGHFINHPYYFGFVSTYLNNVKNKRLSKQEKINLTREIVKDTVVQQKIIKFY